jgi:hypothetical protein
MTEIKPGDIVTILSYNKKVFLLVKTYPSNNGNFKAVNSKNHLEWVNKLQVIAVKNR